MDKIIERIQSYLATPSQAQERISDLLIELRHRGVNFDIQIINEDGHKYFRAFAGAHKASVESHIPLGVIFDENISAERLREFPIVYIPNATMCIFY